MRLENQSSKNDRTEQQVRNTEARNINGGLLDLVPNENGLKTFKSIISKQYSELTNMFPTLELTESTPVVSRKEGARSAHNQPRDRAEGRKAEDPNTGATPDWSGVKHKSGGAPDLSGVKDRSGSSQERKGLKDNSGAAPRERADAKESKPAWSKYLPSGDSARDQKATAQTADVGTYIEFPVGRATREKVELLDSHVNEVFKTPALTELLERSDSIINNASNRIKQHGQ